MKRIHLFPDGKVEVGTANRRNPKPGFRWVGAYSAIVSKISVSIPHSRKQWQLTASNDELKLVFHKDKQRALCEFAFDVANDAIELAEKALGIIT